MLQNPMLATWIVDHARSIGSSAPSPCATHSRMSGVWMNAAQFPQRAFLASSTGTLKIRAFSFQNIDDGCSGSIGP